MQSKSQRRCAATALIGIFVVGSAPAIVPALGGETTGLRVPVSDPAALNTNASSDIGFDGYPSLAHDGNGTWVAVWESKQNINGNIGTDSDIFTAHSSDHGVTWSTPIVLNSTATADGTANDTLPTVATDGLGVWICAWECRFNTAGTGPDVDIFFSRSTDNGMTWSAAAPLNSNATIDSGADYDPQLIADANGNWLAVWRSVDTLVGTIGNDADILFSRSTNGGAPGTWTFPQPLNTNATSDSGQDIKPRIATDGKGRWIVVWESSDSLGGSIGSDDDILYSTANWNGGDAIVWSAPAPLNSTASSDTSAIDDTDASIATDSNGNWMVAWTSNNSLTGTIGTDLDILCSRSTDNGVTWSPVLPLNMNAASDSGSDQSPCIVAGVDGEWAVLWTSTDTLGGTIGVDLDLLVSRSSDHGETWSMPAAFNAYATSDNSPDESPCLLADHRGAWVAVWQSQHHLNGTIGNDYDIIISRFVLPDCNQNMIPDSTEPDCNSNSIPDDCDIASGTSSDANQNGIPDECDAPPACLADCAVPNDGVVNVNDLLFIINNWGSRGPADISPPGPPVGDGIVNVNDLLAVINAWGPCP